ncbi:MAG: hypothetical protein ACK42Z_02325, partial [Candidatus Kapaibacteriota bacterium]
RNYILESKGFLHDASLPALCHNFLNGKLTDPAQIANFESLARKVSVAFNFSDLNTFASAYIDAFSFGYNMAFAIAATAMVVSLIVYVLFKKFLPEKVKISTETKKDTTVSFLSGQNIFPLIISVVVFLIVVGVFYFLLNNFSLGLAVALFFAFATWILSASTKEEKPRVVSLLLVFLVVIFFWMSFHQNGLVLTFFARDYTVKEVGPIEQMFFNLGNILILIATVAGLILAFTQKKVFIRIVGGLAFIGFGFWTYLLISNAPTSSPIEPEKFQAFNPLFIVILTFPIMSFFNWLRKRNQEPSTPRKIGIGMLIASVAFVVMLIGSIGLPSPYFIQSANITSWERVGPHWLIVSYLILTIAELFLSPMGLSFVSKVAPTRFQGLMQGGWLLATAVGNKLLFVGSFLWEKIELWEIWLVFVVCCFISAAFIFSIMRRLEKSTS